MSLVTYLNVRDAAVKHLRESIKAQTVCIDAHPGMFDEAEIKRLAVKTPAILTSLLNIKDSGCDEVSAQFVTWILTRADNTDKLYDNALLLVSAVTPVIRSLDAPWCINGGRDISAENLYTGSLDKWNITIWAVSWKWILRASIFDGSQGGILLPDDLENFEGYDAEHRAGGATANDTVTL